MSAGHDRWSDDLAAYLLDALEPDEASALERHLAECTECRTELRWLAPAKLTLPESVEMVDPPPALRDRVMTQVRAEAPSARASASTRTERRPFMRSWRPFAAVAAIALVLVLVVGVAVRDDGSGGGGTTSQTTLATAGKAPGVRAKMVSEGGDRGATLELAGVRHIPKGRVLEAWVQRGGVVKPVRRALFAPDRDGRASTRIPSTEGVEVVMVTAEPRGGSERPTSSPLVTLKMPVE